MTFVNISGKIVEVDERGVLKAKTVEIKKPGGRVDIEIHVPSLKIVSRNTKEA